MATADIQKDLDELDRIQGMTQDEAYAASVARGGRAPEIAGAQDVAARIPQAKVDAARPAGTVVGADGNLSWANGQVVGARPQNYESLESTRKMRDLAANGEKYGQWLGYQRGMMPKTWSEVSAAKKAERSAADAAARQQLIDANNVALERRRKAKHTFSKMVGDQMGVALADLNNNLAAAQAQAKEGTASGTYDPAKNGSLHYDGKTRKWYVRGMVSAEAAGIGNAEAAKTGTKDTLDKMFVQIETDKFGNPVKGSDGKPLAPTFHMLWTKNGGVKEGGDGTRLKNFTMADAQRITREANKGLGANEDDIDRILSDQFGAYYTRPLDRRMGEAKVANVEASVGEAERAAKIKADGEILAAQMKAQNGGKGKIPSQILDALFADAREGGVDINGRPITRPLTSKELMERYNMLQEIEKGNKGLQDIIALVGLEGLSDLEKEALGLIGPRSGARAQTKGAATPAKSGGAEWKEGAEYVEGMNVPVGGSVKRGGKTYYMWSDGNFHSKKETK